MRGGCDRRIDAPEAHGRPHFLDVQRSVLMTRPFVSLALLIVVSACAPRADDEPDDEGAQGDGAEEPASTLHATEVPSPYPEDPEPFSLPTDTFDHECEGDEDFCEPVADLLRPWFDILAVWSRIEGDALVVETLFSGPSFLCPGQFGMVVAEPGEIGDVQACANIVDGVARCAGGSLYIEVPTWAEYDDGGQSGRSFFPPVDTVFYEAFGPSGPTFYFPGLLAFGRSGRLMQLHVPLALINSDGSIPQFSLVMNNGGDVTFGDEGVIVVNPSRGGAINDDPATAPMPPMVIDSREFCQ